MSQSNLPENVTEIGHVRVSVGLGQHGTGTAFGIEGLSREAAIGHLTAVIDRLREEVACAWDEGEPVHIEIECPHCGEPFVIGEPDDDDEEDDEY